LELFGGGGDDQPVQGGDEQIPRKRQPDLVAPAARRWLRATNNTGVTVGATAASPTRMTNARAMENRSPAVAPSCWTNASVNTTERKAATTAAQTTYDRNNHDSDRRTAYGNAPNNPP